MTRQAGPWGLLVAAGCLLSGCVRPGADYAAVSAIFSSNCTTRSCHGEIGRRGGLVLTPEAAIDQLVGVPAMDATARNKGKLRVVPGNPEASFLYQKLVAPEPGEGELMPYGNAPLAATELEIIRKWIADGARRSAGAVITAP